jgi:hypothetical protein
MLRYVLGFLLKKLHLFNAKFLCLDTLTGVCRTHINMTRIKVNDWYDGVGLELWVCLFQNFKFEFSW